MRPVTLVLGPLLLSASLGAGALAQQTRPAPAPARGQADGYAREFAASDTNKDGTLSRAEVQARIVRMGAGAKKIDAVHARRLADLWFDRADADKDGKVTQAEGQALLTAVARRYDLNGDGRIDPAERAAAARQGR